MNTTKILSTVTGVLALSTLTASAAKKQEQPNIIFILSDDAANTALSCYNGRYSAVFQTKNIDRIAREGVRFDHCYALNSISVPSRATILTGQYSHKNGVYTLDDALDTKSETMPVLFQRAGYSTALVGKWHLVSEPQGFDYYFAMKGQGRYFNPFFNVKGQLNGPTFEKSKGTEFKGRHITSLIGDKSLEWLDSRDKSKPFMLLCHFKAPHRPCEPDPKFNDLFKDITLPEPANLYENYEGKGKYNDFLRLRYEDMIKEDLKTDLPTNLSRDEFRKWAYQVYMKDYLRCMAGVDENVGRLLDYLDKNGLTENTIVVYTSDQGFFLGEHGWFDKRMMYEESINMPFVIRYPKALKSQQVNNDIITNADFAPTFLEMAGIKTPTTMQGKSFFRNAEGKTPANWRKAFYYRYWMNNEIYHKTVAHFGIRTADYKLIFYYGNPLGKKGSSNYTAAYTPEWELFDLHKDPQEMKNEYNNPQYASVIKSLKKELLKLKKQSGDTEDNKMAEMQEIMKKYYW
jgi:arylsulfatase A-like enzyme